eukprot:TRINITY_DN3969_c0_g1_i3.p1 TRINITY_DN3969_c0_g1~~TRINITY_DN3969_c0_g1_i3.p1  ORF type:complete len:247 (+),score=20.39 TRINITY_DN3969_c0_g1_i3:65-805(+)
MCIRDRSITSDRICPIFHISSVTNKGVPELTKFMYLLKNRTRGSAASLLKQPAEFDIQEHFLVSGVGLVVSGVVRQGVIKPNQTMLLGPDRTKQFRPISIRSIHVNRVQAVEAYTGQFACLCIKSLKKDTLNRSDFRKGMCIVDPALKPEAIWEFEADIVILHHATTIKPGYQAVVHCGVVRQAVNIKEMGSDLLRTGDKGQVRFRIMYNPEYIKKGSTILLREGRTKILGVITELFKEQELQANT